MLEIITWSQLRLHAKPCILINTLGYWNRFLDFLDSTVEAGFLKPENRALVLVAGSAQDAIALLHQICERSLKS
jgi:predicted Rossmann-fold nucleotide-binding protein